MNQINHASGPRIRGSTGGAWGKDKLWMREMRLTTPGVPIGAVILSHCNHTVSAQEQ